MSSSIYEYLTSLENQLIANDFNQLEFTKPSNIEAELELPCVFDIAVELFGFPVADGETISRPRTTEGQLRFFGTREAYRSIGIILVLRALMAPIGAMTLRLFGEDINSIILGPVEDRLDFFEFVPTSLKYWFSSENGEFARPSLKTEDKNRPSFGYVIKQDKVLRADDRVPDWASDAVVIEGQANAILRLGSILLDFSHPDSPSRGLLHLERRFEHVNMWRYSYDIEFNIGSNL